MSDHLLLYMWLNVCVWLYTNVCMVFTNVCINIFSFVVERFAECCSRHVDKYSGYGCTVT